MSCATQKLVVHASHLSTCKPDYVFKCPASIVTISHVCMYIHMYVCMCTHIILRMNLPCMFIAHSGRQIPPLHRTVIPRQIVPDADDIHVLPLPNRLHKYNISDY